MILRSHKMDISMPLLMILAIFDGCMGMNPEDIKWTTELKHKLIQVYHRTFPFKPGHSKRMLYLWNRKNPSHKVSDHEALLRQALFEIEEKNKELIDSESRRMEWTREMQVDLLYIRHKVRKEKEVMVKGIFAKWKMLHPQYNMLPSDLEKYSQFLEDGNIIHPTEEELRKAREKYDRVIAPTKKLGKDFKKKKYQAGPKKPFLRWTPKLKTELYYIGHRLIADSYHLHPYLKKRWNEMNKNYYFKSEESLLTRFKRLRKEGFVPKAKDMQDVERRYDKLPPISTQDLKQKEKCCETDDYPTVSAHSEPHGWKISQHHSGHPTPTREQHEPSSSHHVDHTYHQSMNASDTAGATSSHYRGDHDLGDKIPSPSQFYQDKLHHQYPDHPIYSPTYHDDFFYPPEYDVHPFTLNAEDMQDVETRYDKLPPISTQDLKQKEKCCETDDYPTVSAHSDPHGWKISQHHSGHPTPTREQHEPSSSHHVDHTYHQSMNASDTAGASSSYYRGNPDPGEKISSPSQFHQGELYQQHLDDPIYSPSYQEDFFYPSEYDVDPFASSFHPFMYDPSHDPGESSSSQPPGDNRGQHPPQP